MSDQPQNYRELEKSIHTDLKDQLTYSKYLRLDDILNAQDRLSDEHDEMLSWPVTRWQQPFATLRNTTSGTPSRSSRGSS
jgi:hypothetical protein